MPWMMFNLRRKIQAGNAKTLELKRSRESKFNPVKGPSGAGYFLVAKEVF